MKFHHVTINSGHTLLQDSRFDMSDPIVKHFFDCCVEVIRQGYILDTDGIMPFSEGTTFEGEISENSFFLLMRKRDIPILCFYGAGDEKTAKDVIGRLEAVNYYGIERCDNIAERLIAPFVCDFVFPAAIAFPYENYWSGSFVRAFAASFFEKQHITM